MCTSLVVNKNKTIVGWNLDLLDMEYRIRETETAVLIEINDPKEGWLPLFGANNRGDFVGMPTCWPFDERSNPKGNEENIIMLDIDLLLQKKTFNEIKDIAEHKSICSVPGLTFMSALSDKNGNVLHIIPGQGYIYSSVTNGTQPFVYPTANKSAKGGAKPATMGPRKAEILSNFKKMK